MENENNDESTFDFLIVNPENGGILDLFKFLLLNNQESGAKFIESSLGGTLLDQLFGDEDDEEGERVGEERETPDHRWVIFVSIIARKIIKVLGKPMEWTGYVVEYLLNLLSLNGEFLGLLYRIITAKVVFPQRGSETFISVIGHIDERIDLYKNEFSPDDIAEPGGENRALVDLCVMASKLAYENENVVRNVVNLHWKMHFVDFYNCWNEYQKEYSTQVFMLCDKPKDANLILISFRGTEPFDADDWITDFDYSWYEIPELGKVHMGFLEALGLGNRVNSSSFFQLLQVKKANTNGLEGHVLSSSKQPNGMPGPDLVPVMGERTAYFSVRSKLKSLLKEHKNAKFVVTGHSLGAALAVLFPTMLVLHEENEVMKRLFGIYTFGQPRVGNRKLRRFMETHLEHPESKYFRIVYCNDLVPRLPYDDRTFLYKHFGICLYYDSLYIEHKVREEPNRNYFDLRFLIPSYMNAVWELFRSFIMGYVHGPQYRETWESTILRIVGLAIPGLSAHGPVDYVNSVRLGRKGSIDIQAL